MSKQKSKPKAKPSTRTTAKRKKTTTKPKQKADLSEFKKDDSIGLGDVVETITQATGIKKAVEWIMGDDCGCDERKEKLNKIRFSRTNRTPNCLNESEFKLLDELYSRTLINKLTKEEAEDIYKAHCRVFGYKYQKGYCTSCSGKYIKTCLLELKPIFDTYE